jgi:hypothetical protein
MLSVKQFAIVAIACTIATLIGFKVGTAIDKLHRNNACYPSSFDQRFGKWPLPQDWPWLLDHRRII